MYAAATRTQLFWTYTTNDGPGSVSRRWQLSSSGSATMTRSSITYSSAISNTDTNASSGRGEGGGVAVRGGKLRMVSGSFLQHNFASHSGNSLIITGDVTYVFPPAPGTWIAARSCKVYRQACEVEGMTDLSGDSDACERTQEACSLETNRSVIIDGTICREPLFIQPCDCELLQRR